MGGGFRQELLNGTEVARRALKPCPPFYPVISLRGPYPKEIIQKTKSHFIRIFIGKSFIIGEDWKQPNCPTERGPAKP